VDCTNRFTARRPDIAGQNKANPLAAILSTALMLRLSFDQEEAAAGDRKSRRRRASERVPHWRHRATGVPFGQLHGNGEARAGEELQQ